MASSNPILIALTALAVISIASADPARTDPTPEITVFTDAAGANVVTLVHNPPSLAPHQPLNFAMNEKVDGKTKMRNVGNSVVGLGKKSYWVRTRFIDGKLICEKFARRPDDQAELEALAKVLLADPCN